MSKRKLFVIYTTRDELINLELLKNIDNELKNFGEVFIDLIHNTSDEKQEFVIQKMIEATEIVLIKTPNLMKSEWVEIELNLARELNKPIFGVYSLNKHGQLKFNKNGNEQTFLQYI